MKRLILLLTTALVMAAMMAMAGSASAAHFHQHQLDTPGQGDPNIAQGFCKNKNHTAFSNFHDNVHRGAPGLQDNEQVAIKVVGAC